MGLDFFVRDSPLSIRKGKQSFRSLTLIELLVVIALISILTAFVLASLNLVKRERVIDATALSNLKQIGTILLLNAADKTRPSLRRSIPLRD